MLKDLIALRENNDNAAYQEHHCQSHIDNGDIPFDVTRSCSVTLSPVLDIARLTWGDKTCRPTSG